MNSGAFFCIVGILPLFNMEKNGIYLTFKLFCGTIKKKWFSAPLY